MTGRQRIARVRRQYNQWVGNQTLEDYALRFTARGARRWSLFRVSNTALGAISFLACEAIGGSRLPWMDERVILARDDERRLRDTPRLIGDRAMVDRDKVAV